MKRIHIPVIHGPPTELMNTLKNFVKATASYKLSLAAVNVSGSGFHRVPAAVPTSDLNDGIEWCIPISGN